MKVAIYENPADNSFNMDIANIFGAGFSDSGVDVVFPTTRDGWDSNANLHFIIEPGGFFNMEEGIRMQRNRPNNLISISMTQPFIPGWWQSNMEWITRTKMVIDINHESYLTLRQMGLKAFYWPLGISSWWGHKVQPIKELYFAQYMGEEWARGAWENRPVDIIFFYSETPRRVEWINQNRDFLNSHPSLLLGQHFTEPFRPGKNTIMTTQVSVSVAQASRIALNIHRRDELYFESHRINFLGMAQGCLVVSEPCTPQPPFEPGIDYWECELKDMRDCLEFFLTTPEGQLAAKEMLKNASMKLLQENSAKYAQEFLKFYEDGVQSRKEIFISSKKSFLELNSYLTRQNINVLHCGKEPKNLAKRTKALKINHGCNYEFLPESIPHTNGREPIQRSYKLYLYLKENLFDKVIFEENAWTGFHCLLAKNQGEFPDTEFVIERLEKPLPEDDLDNLVQNYMTGKSEELLSRPLSVLSSAAKRVSVCMIHHNRPDLVDQAISGLLAQDYPNFEVLLLDNGSDIQEARDYLRKAEALFQYKGWRIIYDVARELGTARNEVAHRARGEYLIFHDDDNVMKPIGISHMVGALESSGVDVLTTTQEGFFSYNYPKKSTFYQPFLGGCPEIGLFFNCFGDSMAIWKKEAFAKVGGWNPELSIEDWRTFARGVLRGMKLETIPHACYWYRTHPGTNQNSYYNSPQEKRELLELYIKEGGAEAIWKAAGIAQQTMGEMGGKRPRPKPKKFFGQD